MTRTTSLIWISANIFDMSSDPTTALFVRVPAEHAERLHRAATALSVHKKDLVAGLIDRYVQPDSSAALEALGDLAAASARPRRVTIDLEDPALPLGHHAFRPHLPEEVLTAAQAAELFAVDEQAITDLAEDGSVPARKIAGQWRFARQALLDWLSGRPTHDP
jgi:excisionase family DNA binding protein